MQGLHLLDANSSFEASVTATKPWLLMRSVSAIIITLGHVLFAVHIAWLWLLRDKTGPAQSPFFYVRPILVKSPMKVPGR